MHLFKIILLAGNCAGQTSLLHRFVDNSFSHSTLATIGADFKTMKLTLKDEEVKLQIWDTPGQERFKSVYTAYVRGTACLMLFVDLTRKESIDHARSVINEVKQSQGFVSNSWKPTPSAFPPILVVATKLDLTFNEKYYGEVSDDDLEKFSLSIDAIGYVKTSARTAENVEFAFTQAATAGLYFATHQISELEKMKCDEVGYKDYVGSYISLSEDEKSKKIQDALNEEIIFFGLHLSDTLKKTLSYGQFIANNQGKILSIHYQTEKSSHSSTIGNLRNLKEQLRKLNIIDDIKIENNCLLIETDTPKDTLRLEFLLKSAGILSTPVNNITKKLQL